MSGNVIEGVEFEELGNWTGELEQPKPKNQFSDRATIIHRVKEIYGWFLEGLSDTEVVEKCREKYAVSAGTSYAYIRRLRKRLDKEAQKDIATNRNTVIARWEKIYKDVYKILDYRGAMVCLEKLTNLYGLEPGNLVMTDPADEVAYIEMVKKKLIEGNPILLEKPQNKSKFQISS